MEKKKAKGDASRTGSRPTTTASRKNHSENTNTGTPSKKTNTGGTPSNLGSNVKVNDNIQCLQVQDSPENDQSNLLQPTQLNDNFTGKLD